MENRSRQMNQTNYRQQLEEKITFIVEQTELFPDEISRNTAELSVEDLEKLTIKLHVAQKQSEKLSHEEKEQLENHLAAYYNGKKRIYSKARGAWIAHHEAKSEAQESLFESALLEQL